MSSVRVLPETIVSKIAAGEVIERPASALKELIENALDAKTTSIEAALKNAGKTLISVKDDGCGMSRQDLETIFVRHATSKISGLDDLYAIHSLGFRGEALYSIAAVADVTVTSSAAAPAGWELHVRENKRLQLKPCACAKGTMVEIKELFFNTPARKKFLKSDATEMNQLLDVFLPYCLLYPGKRFKLSHNGRVTVDLSPQKSFKERASKTLNLNPEHIIESVHSLCADEIKLRLVLGDMNIQRARRDLQFIFVNERPVQNRSISFHLNEVYRLLLPQRVYPFFAVFIELPAQDVDVNIHPAKREIKIKNEDKLISLMRQACEHSLMKSGKAKQPAGWQAKETPAAYSGRTLPQADVISPENFVETTFAFAREEKQPALEGTLRDKLKKARYLGNLLKKYLLFETEASLLVIDQHAAQERIAFERLQRQFAKGAVEVQPLLAPIVVKLSPQEKLRWDDVQGTLRKAGFETTLFDNQTLAVHAHPHLITDPVQSVRNLLAGERIAKLSTDELARLACHSSVAAGFAMNPEQADFQRRELLACSHPFTCPHGRPTVIDMPESMISRQFLR
jgi:DNA mismatch repair protein MutL